MNSRNRASGGAIHYSNLKKDRLANFDSSRKSDALRRGTALPPKRGRRYLRLALMLVHAVWLAGLVVLLVSPAAWARVVPGYYIVELTESPPVEQMVSAGAVRRKSAMRDYYDVVRHQQQVVRGVLESLGARPYGAVGTVANALLVRLSDKLAQRLPALPGVRRVYPVREQRMSLERALELHHVIDGWNRLGGADLAGAGVKIGIVDSGIDITHPAFQDPSLPVPEGFPRVNFPSDLAYTNSKVIVARGYLSFFFGGDPGARDRNGHGTAVAMAAAGRVLDTPDGPIAGVAPKAWLGSYQVIRDDGTTRSDLVLKAIDDAVRDGMNVINLSLGGDIIPRPGDDIFTRVIERAAAAGVLVVVAAGNQGPDPFTLGDTSVAPSVLAVGATWNDRTLGSAVHLASGETFSAFPGNGPRPLYPVTAPIRDVADLDPTGLACSSLPDGSLAGRIVLIQRGECFFRDKLNNAEAAGAVGAVIFTRPDDPDAFPFDVLGATLPAVMVNNSDGETIKGIIASGGPVVTTLDFRVKRSVDPNRVVSFSSRGPSSDLSIKPEIAAVGAALNTATLDGGFDTTQGTSFSAPIVAGAAAVLMAARPGYSVPQYRSLLINTADTLVLGSGKPAPVQAAGGGVLNLDRALATTITAIPATVSFGDTTGALERRLTISNLGTTPETLTITAQPFDGGPPPNAAPASFTVAPGASQPVTLTLAPPGSPAGEHQGFLWIRGSRTGAEIHVPYWYAITSDEPANLTIVHSAGSGTAGELLSRAIGVRLTDAAGVPIVRVLPRVTAVSGGGTVQSVISADESSPGLFEVSVRLGAVAGPNVFRIEAGDLSKEVTIEGQ